MAHHKKRRPWSPGRCHCKWWKVPGIKGGLRAKKRRQAFRFEDTSMR